MRFSAFNGEWICTSLSKISYSLKYGIGASAVDYDGQHRYIRITDISNYSDNERNFVSPSFLDDKAILKEGDILLARTGATVGDSFIFKSECEYNAYYAGFLIRARIRNNNPYFIYYQLKTDRYNKWVKIMSARSGQPGINSEEYGSFAINLPSIQEQDKIALLLRKIDMRIDSQNKIIEKYESLIKQLNDDLFSREINCKIGDFIQECSKRNKDGAILNVLSVSNKNGFVKQSEQFEDKELASEDKTNYKIVQKGDFAFNPARINVGSIALLKKQETGIVSPMYICFKAKNIPSEVLESYFSSSSFKKEMNKRLEGSVRMCLTIDGMKNVRFHKPDEKEVNLLNHLTKLKDFVSINKKILDLYNSQKKYLLSNLFI